MWWVCVFDALLLVSRDKYVRDKYVRDKYVRDKYVRDKYVRDKYVRDKYVRDKYVRDANVIALTSALASVSVCDMRTKTSTLAIT